MEVDEDNNLFFYGKEVPNQTIAGQPLSISDLAVIYRAMFHHGYNEPYISLDAHGDNRYAKVNFGGHFENTRVGHVVLEADKLFKMLGTGLDPNTHKIVKSKITTHVPDFLTEDERDILEGSMEGSTQIRYWFYPDEIGSVTDGSIGVVRKHQFLADAERTDIEMDLDRATRETINHLNDTYPQYVKSHKIYQELNTVGSIMALVNWMREMDIADRVELDDLLSVKIPAFTTPEKTKKMLAVTALVHPENSKITSQNVRDYTRTYYLSHLLDEYSATTSDDEFLEIAYDYLPDDKLIEIYSPYKDLEEQINDYAKEIDSTERELDLLDAAIDEKDATLNIYSSGEVEEYNSLVNKYNSVYENYSLLIETYNAKVDELNEMNIIMGMIASIGGGISLNPREFKQTIIDRDSPAIREVVEIKNQLTSTGNISKTGDWLRSNAGGSGSRINELPRIAWDLTKSENGTVKYAYRSEPDDVALLEFSQDMKDVEYSLQVNGYKDVLKYSKEENRLEVAHSDFSATCFGEVSADGSYIVFSK